MDLSVATAPATGCNVLPVGKIMIETKAFLKHHNDHVMKKLKRKLTTITLLMLGLAALPLSGYAGQAMTITAQGALLTDALDKLSEQYQVFFAYDADLLRNIEVNDDLSQYRSFEDAITGLLRKSGLDYDLLSAKYCVIYRDTRQGSRTKRKLERKIKQIEALEARIKHFEQLFKREHALRQVCQEEEA